MSGQRPGDGAQQSRVLVCGGAGFIGSHVVERLVVEGREVDVVDDLSSGALANLSDARNATGRFKFQNIAVGSAEFPELLVMRRPDLVVNLVAFTAARAHTLGAMASLNDCVAVLEAARLAGVRKVVTTVPAGLLYGEVTARETPVKEDHRSEPRTVADVMARAAASVHGVYRDHHGLDFTVLAVANAYGPRQRPEDGVVASFMDALSHNRPPIVHGSGKQTRDFVHVDDVVDAVVRAGEKAGGLVINVGTGVSTSVSDLWRMMAGASAKSPRTSSARPDDLARLALSPVRARIQLGWSPFTSLAEGLKNSR